jgi:DNA invertase Pin-like site-specific DNA recombinase
MDQDQDKYYDNVACTVCNSGSNEEKLLLCDGHCERGFHTYCLNMNNIPLGDWYCPLCTLERAKEEADARPKDESKNVINKVVQQNSKIHVYERVSSKGQNKPEFGRVGLNTQNSTILDYASKNNLTIMSTVTEVGSAWSKDLPLLNKLAKVMKSGEPLVVYSVSRFSRNVEKANDIIGILHRKNCFVWSITDQISSHDSEFIVLLKSAENESKLLSTKMIEVNKRIRKQGGFIGSKSPFGYNIIRNKTGLRVLKKNIVEQRIVKFIKNVHNESSSYGKTLRKLRIVYPRYELSETKIADIINDDTENTYSVEKDFSNDLADALDQVNEDEIQVKRLRMSQQ